MNANQPICSSTQATNNHMCPSPTPLSSSIPKLYSNLAVSTYHINPLHKRFSLYSCSDFGQNTTHPGSDMCANNDVVYLYTIPHPMEPPAMATDASTPDPTVIPRLPPHHPSRARQARQASRTQSRRNTHDSRRRMRISRGSARLRWTIPHEVRNKCVRLGWTAKVASGARQSVFGHFDLAGRFCRRIGNVSPSPKSIKHKDIKYHEKYSGLSSMEVRYKILQLLLENNGPTLGAAEI